MTLSQINKKPNVEDATKLKIICMYVEIFYKAIRKVEKKQG